MRKTGQSAPSGQGQFNTLVQSGTSQSRNEPKLFKGEGSDLNKSEALQGRAKRKLISQTMVLELIDLAKKKGDKQMTKQLWNSYHCQEKVFTKGYKLHSVYCKNRICTLCNSIRKADIINKYLPILQQWDNPYFMTLTIRSVSAKQLRPVIESMIKGLNKIMAKYKKQEQRGTGIKLIGIKSLECNFNPKRRTYNPHFHLIVPDEATATTLKSEWLNYVKICKKTNLPWASKLGQDMRKVTNKENALIEIIKYGTKIFTEADPNEKGQNIPRKIYTKALYNILSAMKGHRLFDRFGFNLPPATRKEAKQVWSTNYTAWQFNPHAHDWFNPETGEVLSNYHAPEDLLYLLRNNIDRNLE